MEQVKKQMELLAKQLNLTDLEGEKEPYILSKDDEDYIIANELLRLKQHLAWKMKGLAFDDSQIEAKVKATDWEAEIDRTAILKRANSNKNYELWQKEQREKERQDAAKKALELKELWTAENIYKLMRWTSENVYGKPFILHEHNKQLVMALCFFVSGDSRFETEMNFDLKKGLLIRGVSGLGKTHLVRCIEKNELNPILILSMIEISEEVKSEGEYEIKIGNNKIIYLDDVGTEEATVNHYGTKINYFKNFIEMVYLRNVDKGFGKLIVSTNNSFSEIEEKYGFRVRSRVKDMFNIIDVKGEDMRG
jgi:DNA replication protein DnaC